MSPSCINLFLSGKQALFFSSFLWFGNPNIDLTRYPHPNRIERSYVIDHVVLAISQILRTHASSFNLRVRQDLVTTDAPKEQPSETNASRYHMILRGEVRRSPSVFQSVSTRVNLLPKIVSVPAADKAFGHTFSVQKARAQREPNTIYASPATSQTHHSLQTTTVVPRKTTKGNDGISNRVSLVTCKLSSLLDPRRQPYLPPTQPASNEAMKTDMHVEQHDPSNVPSGMDSTCKDTSYIVWYVHVYIDVRYDYVYMYLSVP